MTITGHGRGWSEPPATGRWARFRQKMREPMTNTDVWVWLFVVPVAAFFAFAVLLGWPK